MSAAIDHLDFELNVSRVEGNQYLVRAKCGKESAKTTFTNPFSEDKKNLIKAEIKANLRSSRKVRSISGPSEVKQLKTWGTQLFEQTITGDVAKLYDKFKAQADQADRGIRWRLALDTSVDDLPWEFLCREGEFLALNPFSPVVRYMPRKARLTPLKESDQPLRLLVVIASPCDEVPLDTGAERDRITRAFESLVAQGVVEIDFIEGAETWRQLYEAVTDQDTHILHFIGHGAYDEETQEGVLVMEDAGRNAEKIRSEAFRVLMQGKSRLRLVVLNSCLGTRGDDSTPFSSVAAGLIQAGVPAVIAMQAEISDDAAHEIADTFYKALARNMPVDAALTEARRKIFLFDLQSLEWATPILYMQVPDGQLFQFKERVGLPAAAPPRPVKLGPETIQGAVAILVRSDNGSEISLSGKSFRIGRGEGNNINVDEQSVSRKHTLLTQVGSTYVIENFGRGGTLVNDKPISGPVTLKHNDVIGVGEARFKFSSLADLVAEVSKPKPESARRDQTTASPDANTFESKAAARYEEGVQFMARGNWPEAIKAFGAARTYVPGFLDVDQKLSVCQSRHRIASLYDEAKKQCAARNYDQALVTLSEVQKLDPDLQDTDKIGELSQTGQKHQQAIAELQRGNLEGGKALLREVLSRHPNFEDAAQRFDNLASGGNGLIAGTGSGTDWIEAGKKWGQEWGKAAWKWFESTPQPQPQLQAPAQGGLAPASPATTAIEPASTTGYAWRTYELADANLDEISEEIRQYFYANSYESQAVEHNGTWAVQGRKAGLVRLIGMGKAATIVIEATSNGMKVSIGGGQWLEKGAVLVAAGVLTGGLTFITSTIGMVQQQQLLDDLWQVTENIVKKRGGRQLAFG
ncbi:MAG TPA: CHAT domain-containing protein [Pyrinomonadaceae bacterium]